MNIKIQGKKITEVNETRFLGVIIDKNLNWISQIDSVHKKVYKNIGILYRIRDKLPTKGLLALYFALILPHLSYCSEVWGNTHKTKLDRIRILQKKAIRIVCKAGFREHSEQLFKQTRSLKFDDIVRVKTCLVMYQANSNSLPKHIQDNFTKVSSIHKYGTRQQDNLHTKLANTTLKQKCISHVGIKLWNNLDSNIKLSNNIKQFHKKIKIKTISKYQ